MLKQFFCLLVLSIGVTTTASAAALDCLLIGPHLGADGSLKTIGDHQNIKGTKKGNVITYIDPDPGVVNSEVQYQVTISSSDGTPTQVRRVASGRKSIGIALLDTDISFEVAFDEVKKCSVIAIKNNEHKSVLFHNEVCNKLSNFLAGMTNPKELSRCSQIMSQMSDVVNSYRQSLPSGWKIEYDISSSNPYEKALLFAAGCREKLGVPGQEKSLSIPQKNGTSR